MSSDYAANSAWILDATHENFLKLGGQFEEKTLTDFLEYTHSPLTPQQLAQKLRVSKHLYERFVWGNSKSYDKKGNLPGLESDVDVHMLDGTAIAYLHCCTEACRYDDMQEGQAYFIFNHCDLFTETPLANELKSKQAMPQWGAWVTYG